MLRIFGTALPVPFILSIYRHHCTGPLCTNACSRRTTSRACLCITRTKLDLRLVTWTARLAAPQLHLVCIMNRRAPTRKNRTSRSHKRICFWMRLLGCTNICLTDTNRVNRMKPLLKNKRVKKMDKVDMMHHHGAGVYHSASFLDVQSCMLLLPKSLWILWMWSLKAQAYRPNLSVSLFLLLFQIRQNL